MFGTWMYPHFPPVCSRTHARFFSTHSRYRTGVSFLIVLMVRTRGDLPPVSPKVTAASRPAWFTSTCDGETVALSFRPLIARIVSPSFTLTPARRSGGATSSSHTSPCAMRLTFHALTDLSHSNSAPRNPRSCGGSGLASPPIAYAWLLPSSPCISHNRSENSLRVETRLSNGT